MYKTFIGKDIEQFRKYLGHWWLLSSQTINGNIGHYCFKRVLHRDVQVRTENNLITDIY